MHAIRFGSRLGRCAIRLGKAPWVSWSMALQRLLPTSETVLIQNTSLGVDALSRHICNTWEEATGNGGAAFSAVVVGAGMYGAYLATRLFRQSPDARILLLEAGPFLVTEH